MAVLSLLSCGRATTLAPDDDGTPPSRPSGVSIAYLRSLASGTSVTIRETLSVSGCVTANDAYGELYKTIHIEDETGGIDIAIDHLRLHTLFALYDRVVVECHGLALGRIGSTVELGMPPTGEYAVDRISAADTGRYISQADGDGLFSPVEVTIGELVPELVGRTVKICGLRATADDCAWCDTDPLTGEFANTTRTVADATGAVLAVDLRGSCIYAPEPMPEGEFSLCGILGYRSGTYALRITNRLIITQH